MSEIINIAESVEARVGVISQRIGRISVSQTLAMNERSQQLKAAGVDVINLSVGEPDFETPAHVKLAAKKAIDDNKSFYTPVAGYPELRQEILKKFKRENNLDFELNQIVVSNGAKQALANVILSLINENDEILVPAPYWVSYAEIDNLAHGKNIFLPTTIDNDFKVTPAQVEAAITPRTRIFLFSSPSNPTGSVYSKEELKALAEVFLRHPDIYIISDEIYEHINFVGKHESIAQFSWIKDRVITINGVSKGYAMTGWRIGYMAAPKWIADSCIKLQGQYTSGPCSISQMAAIAALSSPRIYTLGMNAIFKERRDLVINLMRQIPGLRCNVPQGAFYLFPDASSFLNKSYKNRVINDTSDLCLYLLEEGLVSLVPGEAFGAPGFFRMSYAISDNTLEKAIHRIGESLMKLK